MIQHLFMMMSLTVLGSLFLFAASGCGSNSKDKGRAGDNQSSTSRPAAELTPRDDLIPVGQPAPDFTANDDQGRSLTLSELLKAQSVVLIFYPANNTPTCTKQLCAVRDDWSKFQQKGATVLGINPASVSKHARFAEKHSFPFPVLSDEGARIAEAYGAGGTLFTKRSVYVIGKDGRVALADRGVVSHDRILAALDGS
jgi:peroxiredoxin Q/BCP